MRVTEESRGLIFVGTMDSGGRSARSPLVVGEGARFCGALVQKLPVWLKVGLPRCGSLPLRSNYWKNEMAGMLGFYD